MSIAENLNVLSRDVLGGLDAIDKAMDIIIESQEKMIAGEVVDSAEQERRIRQLFADIGSEKKDVEV